MADILAILTEAGVEIPEDKKAGINKEIRKHYKSVAELEKAKAETANVRTELAAAKQTIEENTAQLGKYDELKTKYETEVEGATKALAEYKFTAQLDKALKGIEFTSKRNKESIIADIKAKEFKADKDGNLEGLNNFLEETFKAEPELFSTVDAAIHTWGKASDDDGVETNPTMFGKLL